MKRPARALLLLLALPLAVAVGGCGSGGETGYDESPPTAKASLAGRVVPRDGDDAEEAVAALTAEAGVDGEAFVEIGHGLEDDALGEACEVEVEGLNLVDGTVLEVFLADAGGTLTSVGTLHVDAEGDGTLLLETEGVGILPLGAASLEELVGRAVEVRLMSDGSLLFSGEVPALLGSRAAGPAARPPGASAALRK